jgi:hypothetical protein
MNIDKLVDAFVAKISSDIRAPGFEDEIPPSVRTGLKNEYGMFEWNIKPYSEINWVEGIEEKICKPLPRSYRSFISRYIFPCFEIGPLFFMANTPEGLNFSLHELRTGIFEDKILSDSLLKNSYIQFARPSGGGYDPVCFDAHRSTENNEYPVVRIDHEGILIKSKIIVVKEIAASFVHFIKNYTNPV